MFEILIHEAIEKAIQEYKENGIPENVYEEMSDFAYELGENGDIMLHGGKRKKDEEKAREMFIELAYKVAAMSFLPNGIEFMGKYYEEKE